MQNATAEYVPRCSNLSAKKREIFLVGFEVRKSTSDPASLPSGDSSFEVYGGYVFVDYDSSIEEQNTRIGSVYVVESAEEALPYIEEMQSDNIFVSLHLSHEILAGNGDRLDEVAAKLKPWIRLPSINGTDVGLLNGFRKW